MITFFIRSNNDIDTYTPILFKLLKENLSVYAVCQNIDYQLKGDYRIEFLKTHFPQQFTVEYWFERDLKASSFFRRNLAKYLKTISETHLRKELNDAICNTQLLRTFHLVVATIVKKGMANPKGKTFLKRLYDCDYFAELIQNSSTKLLILDFVYTFSYYTHAIVQACQIKQISIIEIIHGIYTMYTHSQDEDDCGREFYDRSKYLVFSHKKSFKNYRVKNADPKKYIALGSPRYSPEWVEINDKILPTAKYGFTNKTTVKLLYIERMASTGDEYIRYNRQTIEELLKLDFLEIIIKPHPRDNQSRYFSGDKNRLQIIKDEHTTNLINQADIVLGTASSALFEALVCKKLLIVAPFLHRDKTFFDDSKSCLTVHSVQELIMAIKKFKADPCHKFYKHEDVELFLDEHIYNSDRDKVLSNYKEFLVNQL